MLWNRIFNRRLPVIVFGVNLFSRLGIGLVLTWSMQHLALTVFFTQLSGDDARPRLISIGLLFVNLVTENNNTQ